MFNKIEAKDIINVVKEITFSYKNCNVVLKENNGVINIGITGISDEGMIIEKHQSFVTDAPTWELTTTFLNHKINEIESVYQSVIDENKPKGKNVIKFKNIFEKGIDNIER